MRAILNRMVILLACVLIHTPTPSLETFSISNFISNNSPTTVNICLCNDLRRNGCNMTSTGDLYLLKTCYEPIELKCFRNAKLIIVKAVFGLFDPELCPTNANIYSSRGEVCDESVTATRVIREKCSSQIKCLITPDDSFVDNCPCAPFKYLQITYNCVPALFHRNMFNNFKTHRFEDKKKSDDGSN